MNAAIVFALLLSAASAVSVPCSGVLKDHVRQKEYFYDLTLLTQLPNDIVSGPDSLGNTFYLHMCDQAAAGCAGQSVCQKAKNAKLYGCGATTSQEFLPIDGTESGFLSGLVVSYTHGDTCAYGPERSTKVEVVCNPDYPKEPMAFEAEETECSYTIKLWSASGCPKEVPYTPDGSEDIPQPEAYVTTTSAVGGELDGMRRNVAGLYELESIAGAKYVTNSDRYVYVATDKDIFQVQRGSWTSRKIYTVTESIREISASNNTLFFLSGQTLRAMDTYGKVTVVPIGGISGVTVRGDAFDEEHFAYVTGNSGWAYLVGLDGKITQPLKVPDACTLADMMSYQRNTGKIVYVSARYSSRVCWGSALGSASFTAINLPSGWSKITGVGLKENVVFIIDQTLGIMYAGSDGAWKQFSGPKATTPIDIDFESA